MREEPRVMGPRRADRPVFARYLYSHYTGLRRELDLYLTDYNVDRVHLGRLINGRIPPASSTLPTR